MLRRSHTRLPSKYRHLAPPLEQIVGGTYLVVEGKKPRRLDTAEEKANEDGQNREFRNDPSVVTDLERRLGDQESDGVCAEVIYPNDSLFLYAAPAPAYQMAVARAYNDWAIEGALPTPRVPTVKASDFVPRPRRRRLPHLVSLIPCSDPTGRCNDS